MQVWGVKYQWQLRTWSFLCRWPVVSDISRCWDSLVMPPCCYHLGSLSQKEGERATSTHYGTPSPVSLRLFSLFISLSLERELTYYVRPLATAATAISIPSALKIEFFAQKHTQKRTLLSVTSLQYQWCSLHTCHYGLAVLVWLLYFCILRTLG